MKLLTEHFLNHQYEIKLYTNKKKLGRSPDWNKKLPVTIFNRMLV